MSAARLLSFAAFALSLGPAAWLAARLLRSVGRPRAALLAALVSLAALAGALLAPPHQDLYTGLDVASYRLMAHAFRAGRGLHARDEALASVPPAVRPALRAKPAKATRDGVFRLVAGDPAPRTEPYFLPAMPLAAAALPDPDLFAPLVGALWLLALAAFAARRAPDGPDAAPRAFATALGAFLLTPFPAWFLRGFHPDAVGSALLSLALMAGLDGAPFAAGFLAALSTAFHLELALPAMAVAATVLAAAGSWRANRRFAAGAALGVAPALLELAFAGNPYFHGVSPAAFLRAARQSPELGTLAVLLPAGAAVCAAALALVPSRRLRARLAAPRAAAILAAVLAAAALAAPAAAMAGTRFGCPELARGMASLHPALLAAWGGVALLGAAAGTAARPFVPRTAVLRALHLLLASAVGLFFVYVKGREIPVGMWSYRRFLPIVALLAPWVADAAASAGRNARTRLGAWTPAAVLAAVAAGVLATMPAAYAGVGDRGADEAAARVEALLADADVAVFDYFGHAVPIAAADPARRVFALGDYAARRLPDVVRWLRDEALSGARIALVTGYEPCSLEAGLALAPAGAVDAAPERLASRRLPPARMTARTFRDTVCRAAPALPGCAQRKVFDGGPLGLRGEWRRAPRGGQWSGRGAGIVGPVPSPGGSVRATFRVSWHDATGDTPVRTVRVVPPCGLPAQEFRIGGPGETVTLRFRNDRSAPVPATGVYRIVGEAVFHEASLVPDPRQFSF